MRTNIILNLTGLVVVAVGDQHNCVNRGPANCAFNSFNKLSVLDARKNPYMVRQCGGYCVDDGVCVELNTNCSNSQPPSFVFGDYVGCMDLNPAECIAATSDSKPLCGGWCQKASGHNLCIDGVSTYCNSTDDVLVQLMEDIPCGGRDCFSCFIAAKTDHKCQYCVSTNECQDNGESCSGNIWQSDVNCPQQMAPLTTRAPWKV